MSGVAKSTGGWVTSFFRSDSEDTNIRKPSIWKQIQGYIRPVVEHSAFSQLFMALILVNTFAMCDSVYRCTDVLHLAKCCSGTSIVISIIGLQQPQYMGPYR